MRRLHPVLLLAQMLALLLLMLAAALLMGFLFFVHQIPAAPQNDGQSTHATTDAIVVLTGGKGRIKEGVRLLREGQARYLYISGVNAEVTEREFSKAFAIPPALQKCCVFTDQLADSTLSNAVVTVRWLEDNRLRSIRLVTSNYHMRRSVREFEAQAPELRIIEHPTGKKYTFRRLLMERHTLRFLFDEYIKLLAQGLRQGMGIEIQ